MSIADFVVIASFTAPEEIGTNPSSKLWLLPLAASMVITALALHTLAWLITE